MIDCTTLSDNHRFTGNPIWEQHKLRYASIIERQGWSVPTVRGMEYDSYDNPAAYYLVRRDEAGRALGSSRLYPTDRPYMLEEVFPHLVTFKRLERSSQVWEGSRFCVDSGLAPDLRRRIVQEIVIGYLEFALARDIRTIVGVMFPVYWKNIFIKSGWDVSWLRDVQKSPEGHKIIAGELPVSAAVLANVRAVTGIHTSILKEENESANQAQRMAA